MGSVVVALALAVAVAVPQLRGEPEWYSQSLVIDISSQPEIAWSSQGGRPCEEQSDEDRAILYDDERVWSLDLLNGETVWSVDLPDIGTITCLPTQEAVAVAVLDESNVKYSSTRFLSASTGATVAELPGASIRFVIPLGSTVGLLDDTNMLRAVSLEDLDTPLWTRQLPRPTGGISGMEVDLITDTTVQLRHSTTNGYGGSTTLVQLADGTAPSWSQPESGKDTDYRRVGDVIIRAAPGYDSSGGTVLDLDGRELWELGSKYLGVVGSHLFVASPSSSDPSTGFTHLHEVNPRTGKSLGNGTYNGWFHSAVAVQDHIAVSKGGALYILDDQMAEQPGLIVGVYPEIHVGRKWVYAQNNSGGRVGEGLTAIDLGKARELWRMELEPDQSVARLGRHLIIVELGDEDDSMLFHGVTGES